jgi:hypothetical protein
MARPVVAFLTDFGTKDHYGGTLKGVVLGICPEAACVDITHEIPPHDVMSGALELAAAYKYFPAGTIFLVVVDPGVGSSRRPIAAEAGAYRFVAPDNGVLTGGRGQGRPDICGCRAGRALCAVWKLGSSGDRGERRKRGGAAGARAWGEGDDYKNLVAQGRAGLPPSRKATADHRSLGGGRTARPAGRAG